MILLSTKVIGVSQCFITTWHRTMHHTNFKKARQEWKRKIITRPFVFIWVTLGFSLQIRHTKCTDFNVSIYKNSYVFQASLAHHQGVQLYRIITRPYYHLQYTELWWFNQCRIYRGNYIHWYCKTLSYKREITKIINSKNVDFNNFISLYVFTILII
jgi:hypothetical protein